MNERRWIWIALAMALFLAAGSAAMAQANFGDPANLGPNVNSESAEGSPSMTADGLELYFHSNRSGGQGGMDLMVSKRASTNQAWGQAMNLGPVVNSAAFEIAPTITGDGLELYFTDYVKNRPGGVGKTDIWFTKRASRNAPWQAPVNLGPGVNSEEDEITPVVSDNGLELIFDSYRQGSLGASDLWVARRASRTAPWKKPEWLGAAINSFGVEHCPTITADGLALYFDRTPPGQESEIGDLMLTRRSAPNAPWGPAINLGHSLSDHWAACISPDGKTLYYSSSGPGGLGQGDIWQTAVSLDGEAVALCENVGALYVEYEKQIANLDPVAWIALWDENGVKMMANVAPIVGKQAIGAFAASRFSLFAARTMDIRIDQVEGYGDIAIARGNYTSVDKLKTAAAPVSSEGWFMTVFKVQADGSWKIYRDSIGPVPPPAAK